MKTNIPLLLFSSLFITMAAEAQTTTPKITKRQVNQEARIREGVKSGELTRKEAATLQMREAKIQHDKKVAKKDGVVTPRERAHLQREENKASRAIARKKHNAVTR